VTLAMFAAWLVMAAITGWVAAVATKSGSHGMKADIILALIGSGTACGVAGTIDLFPNSGVAATAVVSIVGAGVALAVQRKFFDAPAADGTRT
jgi:uncharacterized membrane protein YeaQ/YmgE (transglycosylase-associated protein family)